MPARPVLVRSDSVLGARLPILRALRPLRGTTASTRRHELDEDATVRWFATHRRWRAVLRPAATRALDLVLVVDRSPSAPIWDGLVDELRLIFQQLGAFRDIRVRYLVPHANGDMHLTDRQAGQPTRVGGWTVGASDRSARHMVLVLSDCVSAFWRTGAAHQLLAGWSRHHPVAILQPLPEHLWARTNLPPVPGRLRSKGFASPNRYLAFVAREDASAHTDATALPVPVLELSPDWLAPWARLIAGTYDPGINGVVALVGRPSAVEPAAAAPADLSPFDRVLRFRAEATSDAYRLAGYLAAAPLTPAVMRVVQAAMLPRSRPSHLAEVWFSGLFKPVSSSNAQDQHYEFLDGVRDVLLGTLRKHEVSEVLHRVSTYLERQVDTRTRTFTAAVPADGGPLQVSSLSRPFARIRSQALNRLVTEPQPGPLTETPGPTGTPPPASPTSADPSPASATGSRQLRAALSTTRGRLIIATGEPLTAVDQMVTASVATSLPGWSLLRSTELPARRVEQHTVLLLDTTTVTHTGAGATRRLTELVARDDVIVVTIATLAQWRSSERLDLPEALRRLLAEAAHVRVLPETGSITPVPRRLARPDIAGRQTRELLDGLDIPTLLEALRGVDGVRDAALRTTPQGTYSLRLDLADGADPAQVSRSVARLLQERTRLRATPVPGRTTATGDTSEQATATPAPGAVRMEMPVPLVQTKAATTDPHQDHFPVLDSARTDWFSGSDQRESVYSGSTGHYDPPTRTTKVVVAGGFGVGKTTFITALSDLPPVTVEMNMTTSSRDVDDATGMPQKQTLTTARDFGRLTISQDSVVYLFGTPGPTRFWFLWDDIVRGASGAIVLADVRHLTDCFAPLDYFEQRGISFVVALNAFNGQQPHPITDVREALDVGPEVPILTCDARSGESARKVVAALLEMTESLPSRVAAGHGGDQLV